MYIYIYIFGTCLLIDIAALYNMLGICVSMA